MPRGRRWQEPDGGWGEAAGRTDLHVTIDTTGRTADRRDDFAEVYGDWAEVGTRIEPAARRAAAGQGAPARLRAEVLAALRRAEQDPAGLSDAEALALLPHSHASPDTPLPSRAASLSLVAELRAS